MTLDAPPPQAPPHPATQVPSGGHRSRDPDEPPWALWTAPAAILSGVLLWVMGSVLLGGIARAGGSSLTHPTPAVSITSDLIFDLAFVAAAIYFACLHGRARPADFGFRRIRLRTGIAAFVLAGVGYYTATALYQTLFSLRGTDKLPKELGVGKSGAALAAAAVFVCVIAPMAEEFFFRGFLFGALRRWRIEVLGRQLGTWAAAAVTGILFGLAHTGSASSQYLIPLGLLGFILCLVRWRTRSLYPCMALHSFNNSLALGVNELHWGAGPILGLIAGSFLVIGTLTAPLSRPAPATQ